MKTSLNWLSEYVDIKGLSPQEISDGLRLSGTENVLVSSGSLIENVVVGEIKKIDKHPNADKLQITITDVGKDSGGKLQIVCGAPNIKVGQKVPVALVGAKFGEFEIKEAEIRGIKSFGMLCSEKELEISEDHSGIMVLKKEAKVGQSFSDYFGGESIIDAELTPNRGDCLSMTGMAREVAATFGRKFNMPKIDIPEIKSSKAIKVEVDEKTLCPRYIAKVIEGIKIGPSPKWMQERLLAAGVRPISNVVDVTNYVMIELGQPMHAFDASKLSEKIIVRKAKPSDELVTLDGQERKLTPDDLLICDAKKPVALAGVMGGLNSEVDDKTTTVILEAAVFNSTSIRKTAQRLNLRSEASNRFEKGIPLQLPEIAIERAAQLLTEIPGGLAGKTPVVKPKAGKNIDILSGLIYPKSVGIDLSLLEKVIGISLDREQARNILSSLGFESSTIDFKKEARSHIGKPYIFGAKYSTHGDMAFDCSYLTDYIYRKIGKFIGHTALAQVDLGTPIKDSELRPGDLLFIGGYYSKEIPNFYYVPDSDGQHKKVTTNSYPKGVRHVGIYIGDGRVIHARMTKYDFKKKKFTEVSQKDQKVVEESVEEFTKLPDYIGACRYIENINNFLTVEVPWWRLDINIKEDILEEIARIYGYDKIPSKLPSGEMPKIVQNQSVASVKKLKEKLTTLGLTEIITYSFVSEKMIKADEPDLSNSLKINNPLSIDQEYMRRSIWPSHLEVLTKNQDYANEIKIFEIANIYEKIGKKEKEPLHICITIFSKDSKKSFYDLKGIISTILDEYSLSNTEYKKIDASYFTNGQSAKIVTSGKEIGFLGAANSSLSEKYDIKGKIAFAEIDLLEIVPEFGRKISYKTLPKYPVSKRDINIVVPKTVFVKDIEKIISGTATPHLKSFNIRDIYEGKRLPEDKKSVTIGLVIGSDEKTLSEEEISENQNALISVLEKKTGGKLRS